jgi:hypothetical protein
MRVSYGLLLVWDLNRWSGYISSFCTADGDRGTSSCTKDDKILVAGINVRVMTSAMAVVIRSTDLSLACFIEVNP